MNTLESIYWPDNYETASLRYVLNELTKDQGNFLLEYMNDFLMELESELEDKNSWRIRASVAALKRKIEELEKSLNIVI